ncbi:MAG: NADH-quinone oxidoreductase subunit D, partial [Thermomicrobiaceae bacterium]
MSLEISEGTPVEISEERALTENRRQMVLNMGPQHPSTHGVLRVILTMEGETIVDCDPVLGYLHRGVEKLGETHRYSQ